MRELAIRITGDAPLLMHSDVLANPLSEEAKEMKALTAKRKKTDEDHHDIAWAEFKNGMYWDPQLGPCVKGLMLWRSIQDGAKKEKRGKDVASGLLITDEMLRLEYDGPRDRETLWKKGYYLQCTVGNQSNRVLRTRPMFRQWAVTCELIYDDTVIDEKPLLQWVRTAGRLCGIGDWRPRYGRYSLEVL